jgi:hypothetical protein
MACLKVRSAPPAPGSILEDTAQLSGLSATLPLPDYGRVASHPTTETFRKPIHRALATGLFMEVADHPGVGRLGRHCRPSRSAVDWLARKVVVLWIRFKR